MALKNCCCNLFSILFTLLLISSLQKPCSAHIHSQKIRNYGGTHSVSFETWTLSLVSACVVGLCGVVPLFLNKWIQLDKVDQNSAVMQTVLSFAVGGLLGDVWLHLLPESWGSDKSEESVRTAGIWVIIGLLSFMFIEKMAKTLQAADSRCDSVKAVVDDGLIQHRDDSPTTKPLFDKDISGYLNLVANVTDNFTHGLAIAASYIVNPLVGVLTTAAIVCHEIPHEVGDFAILLRSGFSIPTAIKAQLLTATGGVVGVAVGLLAEQMGQCTSWMLPFTAGGFLYIAMVSIIPELMQQHSHAVRQLLAVLSGIVVMAAVTVIERRSCAAMPNFSHQ